MVSAPHGNPEFPFTIKTRTKWSKNVRSFKNCPDQIILGSKLWSDCILLHLAWYLEQWLGRNVPTVKFLWTAGEDEEKDPKHIKATYKKIVEVLEDIRFKSTQVEQQPQQQQMMNV
jgi:hypothetical protein